MKRLRSTGMTQRAGTFIGLPKASIEILATLNDDTRAGLAQLKASMDKISALIGKTTAAQRQNKTATDAARLAHIQLSNELKKQTIELQKIQIANAELTKKQKEMSLAQREAAIAAKAHAAAMKEQQAQIGILSGFMSRMSASVKGLILGYLSVEGVRRVISLTKEFYNLAQGVRMARGVIEREFAGSIDTVRRKTAELRSSTLGLINDYTLMTSAARSLLSFKQMCMDAARAMDVFEASAAFAATTAKAMGVDANHALQKITTGLARGSAFFLDDYGIIIDLQNQFYKNLSGIEQRQQTVNDAMIQAAEITANHSTQLASQLTIWDRIAVNVKNIGTNLSEMLFPSPINVHQQIVEELADNPGLLPDSVRAELDRISRELVLGTINPKYRGHTFGDLLSGAGSYENIARGVISRYVSTAGRTPPREIAEISSRITPLLDSLETVASLYTKRGLEPYRDLDVIQTKVSNWTATNAAYSDIGLWARPISRRMQFTAGVSLEDLLKKSIGGAWRGLREERGRQRYPEVRGFETGYIETDAAGNPILGRYFMKQRAEDEKNRVKALADERRAQETRLREMQRESAARFRDEVMATLRSTTMPTPFVDTSITGIPVGPRTGMEAFWGSLRDQRREIVDEAGRSKIETIPGFLSSFKSGAKVFGEGGLSGYIGSQLGAALIASPINAAISGGVGFISTKLFEGVVSLFSSSVKTFEETVEEFKSATRISASIQEYLGNSTAASVYALQAAFGSRYMFARDTEQFGGLAASNDPLYNLLIKLSPNMSQMELLDWKSQFDKILAEWGSTLFGDEEMLNDVLSVLSKIEDNTSKMADIAEMQQDLYEAMFRSQYAASLYGARSEFARERALSLATAQLQSDWESGRYGNIALGGSPVVNPVVSTPSTDVGGGRLLDASEIDPREEEWYYNQTGQSMGKIVIRIEGQQNAVEQIIDASSRSVITVRKDGRIVSTV